MERELSVRQVQSLERGHPKSHGKRVSQEGVSGQPQEVSLGGEER